MAAKVRATARLLLTFLTQSVRLKHQASTQASECEAASEASVASLWKYIVVITKYTQPIIPVCQTKGQNRQKGSQTSHWGQCHQF